MLWNWYTIDSCFIARSWHVTSHGMFAGSCIGVILLVVALEFLRRSGKEYDRYLLRQYKMRAVSTGSPTGSQGPAASNGSKGLLAAAGLASRTGRTTILQQALRALLHMLQFAVAYFIMLLAMYYNGYIIICIFIGAFLGFFIFGWESITLE
jgi:solute carrier family 31 (copper transporter), member 1